MLSPCLKFCSSPRLQSTALATVSSSFACVRALKSKNIAALQQDPEPLAPARQDEAKPATVDEKAAQWYSNDENDALGRAGLVGQLSAADKRSATRLAKMDPSWRHIGLGKRGDMDPTWSMVGLGKRSSGSADPTWGMVGLGKRSLADPTWSMVGLGKRFSGEADPTWSMVGLGKRSVADPTWGMVGLGKRAHSLLRADNAAEALWPSVDIERRR